MLIKINISMPSKHDFKCMKCHELTNFNKNWKTNITNNVEDKGILFSIIDKVLELKVDTISKDYSYAIDQLRMDDPHNFTDSGKSFHANCMQSNNWQINYEPKSTKKLISYCKYFNSISIPIHNGRKQ